MMQKNDFHCSHTSAARGSPLDSGATWRMNISSRLLLLVNGDSSSVGSGLWTLLAVG